VHKIYLKKISIILVFCLISITTFAVADSNKTLSCMVYGELYYGYDFANPANHERPDFVYNHKRHNELNANLIFAKVAYADKVTRANLSIMAGNYAQYNLNNEPLWAQFIHEANFGVKLLKRKNLWLDVGVLPSHIGFESAISNDCWVLTRSFCAENSPYFETGMRLGYTNKVKKLALNFLVLNGWQNIFKSPHSQMTSIGMQATYKLKDAITLNYSNFIGTAQPDSLNALRTYHNIYLINESKKRLNFITGLDIGTDKYNATNYGLWYTPVAIARYRFNNKIASALRIEYFKDKNETLIRTAAASTFNVLGLSTNLDVQITKLVRWRAEIKHTRSTEYVF
jgi:hypothetical protein